VWCKLPCGEADVDWEVRLVSEAKGRGIFAKVPFERWARILVESPLTESAFTALATGGGGYGAPTADAGSSLQAAVQALEPTEGTIAAKFHINALSLREVGPGVGLHTSRANHACVANADWYYEPDLRSLILFARMPIAAGEEVCISYSLLLTADPLPEDAPSHAAQLAIKWRISCPADCACKRAELVALCVRARELHDTISTLVKGHKAPQALRAVEQLLALHDKIGSPPPRRANTLYDGFQVAVLRAKTRGAALRYICEARDIMTALGGPGSRQAVEFGRYAAEPASHRNYLLLEG